MYIDIFQVSLTCYLEFHLKLKLAKIIYVSHEKFKF